jgi:hypothetical protein
MYGESNCELTVAMGYSARACANMDFGRFSGNSLGMISGLRPYDRDYRFEQTSI